MVRLVVPGMQLAAAAEHAHTSALCCPEQGSTSTLHRIGVFEPYSITTLQVLH